MPDTSIRSVTETDLPACARVYADAFAQAPYFEEWPVADAVDLLETLWKASPDLCYCIVHDGEVAGIAFCSTIGRFRAVLEELAIRPRLQGLGYGSRLLRHCMSELRRRGYPRIDLIVNTAAPARDFYQHHGFHRAESYELLLRDL